MHDLKCLVSDINMTQTRKILHLLYKWLHHEKFAKLNISYYET